MTLRYGVHVVWFESNELLYFCFLSIQSISTLNFNKPVMFNETQNTETNNNLSLDDERNSILRESIKVKINHTAMIHIARR